MFFSKSPTMLPLLGAAMAFVLGCVGAAETSSYEFSFAEETISPDDDTTVKLCKPDSNYGERTSLGVDQDLCREYALIRFTVSIDSVDRAVLRLFANDWTPDGPKIYRALSDKWNEGALTWENRPSRGGDPLDDLGEVDAGTWVELDVTDAIDGPGVYAFTFRPDSDDGVDFSSKEGANPPVLIINGSTDDDDNDDDDSGNGRIQHIDTTTDYSGSGNLGLPRPDSRPGDLLVLQMSRTDDYNPLKLDGWNYGASCFKSSNGQNECFTRSDCVEWRDSDKQYCRRFRNDSASGNGHDLAQTIFWKRVGSNEQDSYSWSLLNDHAAWAIMVSLRGANTSDPIRASAGESDDGNPDSLFPSTTGRKGDMLLLSMCFDDRTDASDFNPPDGTRSFGFERGSDEAGYIFGKILDRDGETGELKTHGKGGSDAKDALISFTIRAD